MGWDWWCTECMEYEKEMYLQKRSEKKSIEQINDCFEKNLCWLVFTKAFKFLEFYAYISDFDIFSP